MDSIVDILINKYQLFLIIIVRCSGIFLISPFFSSQNIPTRLKVGFVFFLSITLTSYLQVPIDTIEGPIVVIIFKELMVGLIIGFVSYIFFSTFYVMGQIIDMNIGFGMVNVVDPQNRIQVPVMGNFYYIIAFLLLITYNGHHMIINSLIDSYKYIPIGKFEFNENITYFILDLVSNMFKLGFKLSLPVVLTIFLLDILLGILVRTIPQMNIFVVGLPMKVFLGLIIVLVSIPVFIAVTTNSFNDLAENLQKILMLFSEG